MSDQISQDVQPTCHWEFEHDSTGLVLRVFFFWAGIPLLLPSFPLVMGLFFLLSAGYAFWTFLYQTPSPQEQPDEQ